MLETVGALDLQHRLNDVTFMKSEMRPRRSHPLLSQRPDKIPLVALVAHVQRLGIEINSLGLGEIAASWSSYTS